MLLGLSHQGCVMWGRSM